MATSGKNLICHSSLNDNCTASLFFNDGDPDAEEALSVGIGIYVLNTEI
jgi:hypothetical protein